MEALIAVERKNYNDRLGSSDIVIIKYRIVIFGDV